MNQEGALLLAVALAVLTCVQTFLYLQLLWTLLLARRVHQDEMDRQRTIIEAQERELNQWRREYGMLTNDAIWWQEEIEG